MKTVLFLCLLLLPIYAKDTAVKKVIYNLTTGDIKNFERSVLKATASNIAYYEGQLLELKVAVMIHGDAYKFFVKNLKNSIYKSEKELIKKGEALQKRIRFAHENYGVEFFICEAGMKHRKLRKKDIADFVKLIPNAMIGLIDKQNSGYAYIPID